MPNESSLVTFVVSEFDDFFSEDMPKMALVRAVHGLTKYTGSTEFRSISS